MTPAWRAALLVVTSACAFGSLAPVTVLATADGTVLRVLLFWRYVAATVLLGLLAWRAHRRGVVRVAGPPPWRRPALMLLGGGGQAAVAGLSLSSLAYIPAAATGFLFYTYPAWVALIGAVRGTERLDGRRIGALALALGGIALMIGRPDGAALAPVGILLASAAAVVYAVYIPVVGARQRGLPALEAAFGVALGGTAWFLCWLLVAGDLGEPARLAMSLRGWLGAAAMGVLTAVAFATFLAGLALLGPVRTAVTSTVEPLWTALLGAVVLAQPVGPATLAGGGAVLAAVAWLQTARGTEAADGGASGPVVREAPSGVPVAAAAATSEAES